MFSQCFGILQVRKNEISLPNWSGGTQPRRHRRLWWAKPSKQTSTPPVWSIKYYKSVEFVKF